LPGGVNAHQTPEYTTSPLEGISVVFTLVLLEAVEDVEMLLGTQTGVEE